ncbi:hypothetical protein [Kitasatospora griseola]|nr:hypothetical protein [Kitasatospora griseola]GGQ85997.1 hypothetical protein GCM10010195_47150 [Kitasatospora griseola]
MVNHVIGIVLIVFGAPLVGIAGNVIGEKAHEGVGRAIVAVWFIVRSF